MDATEVLKKAKQRLGQETAPILDYLAKCKAANLQWYLEEKIVKPPDNEQVRDHARALKYAYNFCLHGANVTFVQESSDPGVKTPDLKVELEQWQFYVEVKKFGLQISSGSSYPVSKIVSAVTEKRSQLPDNQVGFVAIDNFDLHLELDDRALTHDHIEEALRELERLAAANPGGWQKPSGVIIAASTSGGIGVSIPHFVWVNKHSKPSAPEGLEEWLSSMFAKIDEEISMQVLRMKLR